MKNNEITILDGEMFDDGSLKCLNFCIATANDYYTCEYDTIQAKFAEHIPSIEANRDKGYIVVGSGADSFEIQWG